MAGSPSRSGRRPVIRRSYEIRVVGSLGPAAREAFTDVDVEVDTTATVLCGDLDQVRLHALLDRMRAFGLELPDIRQIPDQPSRLPCRMRGGQLLSPRRFMKPGAPRGGTFIQEEHLPPEPAR